MICVRARKQVHALVEASLAYRRSRSIPAYAMFVLRVKQHIFKLSKSTEYHQRKRILTPSQLQVQVLPNLTVPIPARTLAHAMAQTRTCPQLSLAWNAERTEIRQQPRVIAIHHTAIRRFPKPYGLLSFGCGAFLIELATAFDARVPSALIVLGRPAVRDHGGAPSCHHVAATAGLGSTVPAK